VKSLTKVSNGRSWGNKVAITERFFSRYYSNIAKELYQ